MGKGQRTKQGKPSAVLGGETWWERHQRTVAIVSAVVAVLALVGGIFWMMQASEEAAQTKHLGTPLTLERVDANTVVLSTKTDAPLLDVFEDPMCPYCRQFESQHGADLIKAAEDGEVQLQINQVNILDKQSDTGNYSSRVGGAYDVLAKQGDASAYLRFHDWVYKNQPSEGTSLKDEKIIEGLRDAGATEETIAAYQKQEWVEEYLKAAADSWTYVQENAEQPGVPVVFTGDKQTANLQDKNWLKDFIQK